MKELKDCPFCGGNGELNLTEINQALQINTVGQAFVECVDCGSNGEIFNNFDNDINKGVLIVNKAISNWNTRNSVSINAIQVLIDNSFIGRIDSDGGSVYVIIASDLKKIIKEDKQSE